MKIIDWLKKSEKLVFWNRCGIHRNDSEFRNLVLNDYKSSRCLKVYSYGDEYHGKIIYRIGAYGRNVGFFSEVIFTLFRLYFADDRGFMLQNIDIYE